MGRIERVLQPADESCRLLLRRRVKTGHPRQRVRARLGPPVHDACVPSACGQGTPPRGTLGVHVLKKEGAPSQTRQPVHLLASVRTVSSHHPLVCQPLCSDPSFTVRFSSGPPDCSRPPQATTTQLCGSATSWDRMWTSSARPTSASTSYRRGRHPPTQIRRRTAATWPSAGSTVDVDRTVDGYYQAHGWRRRGKE